MAGPRLMVAIIKKNIEFYFEVMRALIDIYSNPMISWWRRRGYNINAIPFLYEVLFKSTIPLSASSKFSVCIIIEKIRFAPHPKYHTNSPAWLNKIVIPIIGSLITMIFIGAAIYYGPELLIIPLVKFTLICIVFAIGIPLMVYGIPLINIKMGYRLNYIIAFFGIIWLSMKAFNLRLSEQFFLSAFAGLTIFDLILAYFIIVCTIVTIFIIVVMIMINIARKLII